MMEKAEGPSPENAGPITIMESERREKPPVQAGPSLKKQRIAGLNRGTIKLSEDFDNPLPDEFWLGLE